MVISNSISRLSDYYSRHGLSATFRRAGTGLKRALFANRMIVFYCDLQDRNSRTVAIPNSMRIDRVKSEAELPPQDLQSITSFWNPNQARRNITERFGKGASLWLIRSGEDLAGYGWTLRGNVIAPYYFPLGSGDVQLFDFYVVPKFRGRAMHWLLTAHILQTLAAEGAARAFADTHEWNQAQLSSFKMAPLRRLGMARTFELFGNKYVKWLDMEDRDFGQDLPKRTGEIAENNDKKARTPESCMSAHGLQGLRPAEDLKLHHIGFVVSSIQDCAESFTQGLGASWDGKITFDPIQKVRVTFFEGRNSIDPLIELVEPSEPGSPVSRFLRHGGGLHHFCYEVSDLEGHLEFCKRVGNTVIRQPVPAAAFGGRRIAWVVTQKKLLMEFLER